MVLSRIGTYRSVCGELIHIWIDPSGAERCEVECADGSVRPDREVCDSDVLLSDDPHWPWHDRPQTPSLVFVD